MHCGGLTWCRVFTCYIGMVMLNGGKEGTGQIPHSSLKAHPNSTTRGKISPLMGNKIHHSWLRHSWWICYPSAEIFYHSWWNWDVPFVTHGEFFNSSTRGFAPRGGIDPSLLRLRSALAQSSLVVCVLQDQVCVFNKLSLYILSRRTDLWNNINLSLHMKILFKYLWTFLHTLKFFFV